MRPSCACFWVHSCRRWYPHATGIDSTSNSFFVLRVTTASAFDDMTIDRGVIGLRWASYAGRGCATVDREVDSLLGRCFYGMYKAWLFGVGIKQRSRLGGDVVFVSVVALAVSWKTSEGHVSCPDLRTLLSSGFALSAPHIHASTAD